MTEDGNFDCIDISCAMCEFHKCNANMFLEDHVEYCSKRFVDKDCDMCDSCKFSMCLKRKEG